MLKSEKLFFIVKVLNLLSLIINQYPPIIKTTCSVYYLGRVGLVCLGEGINQHIGEHGDLTCGKLGVVSSIEGRGFWKSAMISTT